MANTKEISSGSIVKATVNGTEGFFRVTAFFATKKGVSVNLGSIFGKTIYHKRVPISEVTEAQTEWYAKWSNSETFQSM